MEVSRMHFTLEVELPTGEILAKRIARATSWGLLQVKLQAAKEFGVELDAVLILADNVAIL
jgi:hypothetical protein